MTERDPLEQHVDKGFNGIKTHIKSIESNLKSEIKQLLILTTNNYTNLKEDIVRVDKNVSELKVNWQKDHDRIIGAEQGLLQQSKEIKLFQEREATFGRQQERSITELKNKANDIEDKLSKVNISIGKVIGIAAGASVIIGFIISIMIYVLDKIK